MDKLKHYILPIADVLTYALMPNHFHLLIYINEIKLKDLQGFKNLGGVAKEQLLFSRQFSNMFNAYTKAFNKTYGRRGSLFNQNFKRKQVDSEEYFKKLCNYIHFNPVIHGYVRHPREWKYSSYNAILSNAKTLINKEIVFELFGSRENFLESHREPMDLSQM